MDIQDLEWDDVAFNWNDDKNEWLKENRGISFPDIVTAIREGDLLRDDEHSNPEQYPGQSMFVVKVDGYVWAVPYVMSVSDEKYFLKTAWPSRKLNRKYGGAYDQ